MATPSLGPYKRAVSVGWPSALPVYISVYVVASRAGLSAGAAPAHLADVTLTPQAITAGCEKVLDYRIQASGSPPGGSFGDMYRITVIKVPKLIGNNNLFNLTLSGSQHLTDDPPNPDFFCGHYSHTQTLSVVGPYDVVFPLPTGFTTFHFIKWKYEWIDVTPDGTQSGSYFIFFGDPDGTPPLPGYSAGGGTHVQEGDFLSYYKDGILRTTTLSCDEVPTNKIEPFPFSVEIRVNPVKDHYVTQPPYPFDPSDAVRTVEDYGDSTEIWKIDLGGHLNDCSIDFAIRNNQFSQLRTDKIIEVCPISPLAGVRYDFFGRPGFRLNKPLPITGSEILGAWDDGFHPEIPLFSGAFPPQLDYDPTL